MQGASSHDGKLHGNRQLVDAYDSDHGKKPRPQKGRPSGGHSGGAHDPEGHDEIKQVVGEHGPAHTHTIEKHESRGYKSTTQHEDGHEHVMHHPELQHHHEHGAHAMDDTDHLSAVGESADRMDDRHGIERTAGGSGGIDFLPGE